MSYQIELTNATDGNRLAFRADMSMRQAFTAKAARARKVVKSETS